MSKGNCGLSTPPQICNVANGENLEVITSWLCQLPETLATNGYSEAVPLWNDIHCNPQRIPILLTRFEDPVPMEWEKRFTAELTNRGLSLSPSNSANAGWVDALRKSYRETAKQWKDSTNILERKLWASLTLYSCLPLYKSGSGGPAFFPSALVPSKGWIAQQASVTKQQDSLMGQLVCFGLASGCSAHCAFQIDILFSKWQLPWTLGATPSRTVSNRSNWYMRVRGGHQLLHRAWLNTQLGCISTRLQIVGDVI